MRFYTCVNRGPLSNSGLTRSPLRSHAPRVFRACDAGARIHEWRGGADDERTRLEQGADVLSREGAMLYTRRCDCFSPPLKVKVGGVKGSSSRMYSHRFGYVV